MKTFLSTTGKGIARAFCGPDGRWSVEKAVEDQEVTCLAADPLRPGMIFAGTRTAGVLSSIDGGQSWTPAGLAGQTIKAIAASPHVPGVLFAGTKPACLFRSLDDGLHWEELSSFRRIFSRSFWFSPAETPFSAYVQGIALSPVDPAVILVGIEAGAVVRSVDGGTTWQDHRHGALRDCHSITFHASKGDWAYEGGGSGAGAAISRDGGNTWKQPKAGLDRHYGWACAADPQDPAICYVSLSPSPFKAHNDGNAQAYIYRSTEGGGWEKLGGGLPQPLDHMPYALLTHINEPGCVYAGLSNGDVWLSADRGDTWEQLPFHLPGIHRQMILV
ncbi:MAG TPA: hypothetical protein PJ988_07765 [Anaerolinea sp.]|nr:hypothetical protein [Anaerolinea sp.]